MMRYKIAVLGFKCVYMLAPVYLQNFAELYTPGLTLRNPSDKLTLSILKMRTLHGELALDTIVQCCGTHYHISAGKLGYQNYRQVSNISRTLVGN